MRVRIFEDEEVRGGGFLLFGQIPFGNQIVFAQLILVKAPEVDQHKESQRNRQVFHFDLAGDVQPNCRGGQHNKDQAAEGRTAKKRFPVIQNHVQVEALLGPHRIVGAIDSQQTAS